MATQQGNVNLLNDPVAQALLTSTHPAQFAYNWHDGTPRVVPIWFHWNGADIVIGTFPGAPKMIALTSGDKVAVTINSETWPYKILLVRGAITVETVDGVLPEYAAAAKRYLGDEAGQGWVEQLDGLFTESYRISVHPQWVGIQDMETRFPSAVEKATAAAA